MQFRKKPIVIEAIQNEKDWSLVYKWLQENSSDGMRKYARNVNGSLDIETLEGTMRANENDWIICGVQGELYPCKPDIFEATYELVEDQC